MVVLQSADRLCQNILPAKLHGELVKLYLNKGNYGILTVFTSETITICMDHVFRNLCDV